MDDFQSSLQIVFSKNRAEEIGYDVWEHFVVPPFFDQLDLKTARKPRVIIGGRGCGKTMLLRYLSHRSTFSRCRSNIPQDATKHIGLYWRTDTQFCNAMTKRGIPDDTWMAAFNHFTSLILAMELLDSLQSIATSSFPPFDLNNLQNADFSRLGAFGLDETKSVNSLHNLLQDLSWKFDQWVNDVRKVAEPLFLPGPKFLLALISIIKEQFPALKDSTFFVYIDEYENLSNYQKRIINTWLKHSEKPLIFNLAMKRNAFDTKQTIGDESLSEIHDFRQHDLELYLYEENFLAFSAEILFLNLSFTNFHANDFPININDLRDPEALFKRRNPEYIKKVISAAQDLFPGMSHKELAKSVFRDKSIKGKLEQRIKQALDYRFSKLKVSSFVRPGLPEASIVASALLFRKRLKPKEIANEMDDLERGEENRFTGQTSWIHNNFIGCLLQLYAPFSRPCPFYAGFKTFCQLSHGNLRHFLELCYKSISRSIDQQGMVDLPISTEKQAEAAKQASADLLGEVRSFGPIGNQLHTFVLRIGSLFSLAHQRVTQSESEQSHFTITKGTEELTPDDDSFFKEATKWSVLFEDTETKKKTRHQPQSMDYILNPIYTPYFHISYRKKKKLELSTSDALCLIRGNLDEFTKLLKHYSKLWTIEPNQEGPTLFSLLEIEDSDENNHAGR